MTEDEIRYHFPDYGKKRTKTGDSCDAPDPFTDGDGWERLTPDPPDVIAINGVEYVRLVPAPRDTSTHGPPPRPADAEGEADTR